MRTAETQRTRRTATAKMNLELRNSGKDKNGNGEQKIQYPTFNT
jgi:hypothetical protein